MGTHLIQLLSIVALEKEWLLRGAHEIFLCVGAAFQPRNGLMQQRTSRLESRSHDL